MRSTIHAATLFSLTFALFAPGAALAQDKKPEAKQAEPKAAADEKKHMPKPLAANAGFDQMKTMVGEWVEADELAAATKEKRAPQIASSFRLTGDGSALCETMFAGTPHEMVTIYHPDGDGLMLTHYCAAHNQPQMKAAKPADSHKIEFKFAGGANIDPATTGHMHDLTLTFVDADHVKAEWAYFSDGKPGEKMTFNLVRKSDSAKPETGKAKS